MSRPSADGTVRHVPRYDGLLVPLGESLRLGRTAARPTSPRAGSTPRPSLFQEHSCASRIPPSSALIVAPALSAFSAPTLQLHVAWPRSALRWRLDSRGTTPRSAWCGSSTPKVTFRETIVSSASWSTDHELRGRQRGDAERVRCGGRAARVRPLRRHGRRRGGRDPGLAPRAVHRRRPHDPDPPDAASALCAQRGRRPGRSGRRDDGGRTVPPLSRASTWTPPR